MKKYYSLLLLFATVSHLNAQQDLFNPFLSRFTYQYLNASKDTVSSLRVIKASKIGGDSVFTFNNITEMGNVPDSNNIFCQKMIQKTNGDFLFVLKGKDTVTLKTKAAVGEQWQLCAIPKTIAKYEGKLMYTFLGTQDTVIKISTDKGFEILISKKYGMVKTIDFKKYLKTRFVKPLFLDAIPEAGLGTFANDFRNIFDFQVGDIFVSKYTNQPGMGSPNYLLTRKEILNRSESVKKDTIYYTTKIDTKKYSYYQIDNGLGTYEHDTITEKYYQETSQNIIFLTRFLSQEILMEGRSRSNIQILFNQKENRYTLTAMTDPFSPMYKTYTSQLGEVKGSSFGEASASKTESTLLCYTKGKERFNDCSIYDNIITTTEPVNEQVSSLKIYPNPTSGLVTIGPGLGVTLSNIKVLNVLGTVVMEENFTSNINLENLPVGVYSVQIYDLHGMLRQT